MDVASRDASDEPIEIVVHPGMKLHELATNLENLNLIESADYFMWRYRIAARLGLEGNYQAGRYRLPSGLKPSKLIHSLTNPDASTRIYTSFTVPPGVTVSRIAQLLQDTGITKAVYVQQAILDMAGTYPVFANFLWVTGLSLS